jgi:hypothetical protein
MVKHRALSYPTGGGNLPDWDCIFAAFVVDPVTGVFDYPVPEAGSRECRNSLGPAERILRTDQE